MSTVTTYYLRKIDGKIYDSEVITEGKTTPMTEDQILFIENYIHQNTRNKFIEWYSRKTLLFI